MGLVFAEIELVSDDDLALNRRGYILEDKIRHCTVRAIVDIGATMLEIPIHVSKQLDLPKIRQIKSELADGQLDFTMWSDPSKSGFPTARRPWRHSLFPERQKHY